MSGKRGGIYARISVRDSKIPKTAVQVAICQANADADGVTIDPRHIFVDDGVAASGKLIDDTTIAKRPGAQQALTAVEAGEFDVLYVVEGERLARTVGDGLAWIAASVSGGVSWHLDTDGALDPSTPSGEDQAMSIFLSGRREGRVRNARQARRYNAERAAGMPLWGTRPFGWEADRITLRESESILIEQAVIAYLAGELSLTEIAHKWNSQGIKTDGMSRPRRGRGTSPDEDKRMPRGRWTTTTVRQLLLRDRNAGIYVHKGAVLPNSKIKPIISLAQLEALRARVKVGVPVGARAKSLLGGIIRCDCGEPMHRTVSYSQRKGGPRREYLIYKCSQIGYDKSRPHASVQLAIADTKVHEAAVAYIATGMLRDESAPNHGSRLAAIAERVAVLAEQEARTEELLVEGLGDKRRHKGRLEQIKTEREGLRDEQSQLEADRASGGTLHAFERAMEAAMRSMNVDLLATVYDLGTTAWKSLPLEDQQAIIRAKLIVTCRTGGRGPDRIDVEPRTSR